MPGDKVFDPCAGSGATLDAVGWFGDMNVTGVGCELDENYYNAALHRLSKSTEKIEFKTYNDEEENDGK